MSDEVDMPDEVWVTPAVLFGKPILYVQELDAERDGATLYRRTPAPLPDSVREALEWYAEMARDCRKLGSLGEGARQSLDKDGGQRAREALTPAPTTGQRKED